jgi:hypothetical protein
MNRLLILLLVLTASIAHGKGNESGGGGDEIRADFMKLGEEIIVFMATDPSGQTLADFHHLDISKLLKTLTIEKITVTDDTLIDQTGSIVDAVISGDKVLLNQARWLSILSGKDDAHYLVFHEMLRLDGIDDDDYRISKGFREILSRRQSLSPDTQTVLIICREFFESKLLFANQIVFARGRDGLPNFSFSLHHIGSSSPLSGNMQTSVRLGTDGFRFSNPTDHAKAFVDLTFDHLHSSVTVTYTSEGNTGEAFNLPCTATASTLVSTSSQVALPLAIEYVAEGM